LDLGEVNSLPLIILFVPGHGAYTPNYGPSKVVAFVESFPTICGMPPAHKEVRAIPNF
jgi:hypothetical protein